MGVFSALTTAVTGMQAQSYALENISGNIANSRTAGFKRVDTSFSDLVPDSALNRQIAGSVASYSRATNTIQGDLNATRIDTNAAINGDGVMTSEVRYCFDPKFMRTVDIDTGEQGRVEAIRPEDTMKVTVLMKLLPDGSWRAALTETELAPC